MPGFLDVFNSVRWCFECTKLGYVEILRVYGVAWGCGRTLAATWARPLWAMWTATGSYPVTLVTGAVCERSNHLVR